MNITIYDYNNKPREVSLPEGVTTLHVQIVTGDEIIYYTDPEKKKMVKVDSSSSRWRDFYDDEYDVTDISAWDEYGKSNPMGLGFSRTISYARLEWAHGKKEN